MMKKNSGMKLLTSAAVKSSIPMLAQLTRLLSLFLCVAALQISAAAEYQWQDVDRVVAIGDVHGDMDALVETLRDAGLINRRNNWTGGATHLVQVGDLPDRGPDTREIVELMKELEEQAREDGGMVHALIGNHEAMNMLGDLRYVHPGEYEAFRTRDSRRIRNNLYAAHLEQVEAANPEFVADDTYRDLFNEQYPLGYVEHRFAWAADGEIGAWVAQHNSIIKINRSLFLHAGISPDVLGTPLEDINNRIRAELTGDLGEEPGLSESETGPLWYRGLAQQDEALEAAHVDAVLAFYDADRIIIGHTPGMGTVIPRFGGKVLLIDTGMSAYYGGHRASLEITGDVFSTQQGDEKVALPTDGSNLLPYLQAIAEIKDTVPAALQALIQQLENPPPPVPPQ